MNIVKQKMEFFQKTLPMIPKKVRALYTFGFSTLTFQNIVSLRSNARLFALNWCTAKSKIYRVVANTTLRSFFHTLVPLLGIVQETDIIAIDFSDFNGLQVLMFAKQTRKGRALPVYFEILEYPIQKNSQNIFVIQTIKHFVSLLGFRPKLVFDRGFACPSIIAFLTKNHHPFIIRIKKKKHVSKKKGEKSFSVEDSDTKDFLAYAYGRTLRFVISDTKEGAKEPWYLVTNDMKSTREDIIKMYYHRFEIEEFFRDAKRVLGLEFVRFKKATSLAVVLWFLLLGQWFLSALEEKTEELKERNRMRLSRMRYVFEMMRREWFVATEGHLLREVLEKPLEKTRV